MLMITVDTENVVVTLRLEGRLAGLEARELERAWSAVKQPPQPVVLDLTCVTSVDAEGKAFLAQAHRSGDWFIAGVSTGAVVGEIVTGSSPENNPSDVSGARRDRRIEGSHTVLVLELRGTLQAPLNGELRRQVEALLGRNERRIFVNLARLSAIDAAGVGALVDAYVITSQAGGVLGVTEASTRVRQLLEVAGVLNLLSLMPHDAGEAA